MALSLLEEVVPVLPQAAEPVVLPVPAGAVKVLPRWNEADEVLKWRLRYRAHVAGEPDATGTDAERRGAKWVEVELRPITRELPLTGLAFDVIHYFQVALQTPDGWSDWSRAVSSVPPAPGRPGQCAGVDAVVKDASTVLVRWTRPIDFSVGGSCGQITRYKLRVVWDPLSSAEDPLACFREIIIDEDADCCEVSDLQCLRNYQFQIAAENVSGWGDFSDPSPIINVPPPVPPKMKMPTLRRIQHHSAVIQWQHPPPSPLGTPIESFRVKLTNTSDWSSGVQERHDIPAGLSQYVVDGLAPGETYIFKVTALNKYGMGIWSDSSLPVTTTQPSRPSKIEGLTVPNVHRSWVTLEWPPASPNGFEVTGHLLRYAHEEDLRDAVEVEPTVEIKDDLERCYLRHLRKMSYYFQVAAFNKLGMSEWSDAVAVDMTKPFKLEEA